jgi:hypothetical protein
MSAGLSVRKSGISVSGSEKFGQRVVKLRYPESNYILDEKDGPIGAGP